MRKNTLLKKGLALTPVKFGISFTLTHLNQAGALVHVYTDGSVHLNHGGTEMGQGLYIKVAQVVAEEFGIDRRPGADHRHDDGQGSQYFADRRLIRLGPERHGGETCRRHHQGAARRFAARHWKVPKSRIRFEDGQVIIGNQSIAFGDLAKKAHQARVSAVLHRLLCNAQGHLGPAPRPRAGRSSISPMARPARK